MSMWNQQQILFGGDYSPEQWFSHPWVLEHDINAMKKANITYVTLGVFSWSTLEPTEGNYNFEWLEKIVKKLEEQHIKIVMSTPSGGKPVWMVKSYPDIARVNQYGKRETDGNRHNHCYSSLIYREKVTKINTELAKRFANTPNVVLWHISNEMESKCYCESCIKAFQKWLEEKYVTIEQLNTEWWNVFWSHEYTTFSDILPPSITGEQCTKILEVEWHRFQTWQIKDFYLHEIAPIKKINKDAVCTTNFFGGIESTIDFHEIASEVDIVSWDSYPSWTMSKEDILVAKKTALNHDLMRSMHVNEPWLLLESTLGTSNWIDASKLKHPKLQDLALVQALAHGSNICGFFQIRQTPGNVEKTHSALLDHSGTDGRIYNTALNFGETLLQLEALINTTVKSECAIYFDWSNKDIIESSLGPRRIGMGYVETIQSFYNVLKSKHIDVDIVHKKSDLSRYKMLVIPMLFSMSEEQIQQIEAYCNTGSILIGTYYTGYANENDLNYLFERPKKEIADIFGIKTLEIDALYPETYNHVTYKGDSYKIKELCEIIEAVDAEVLATYDEDFYSGMPVITTKQYKNIKAFYIAARVEEALLSKLLDEILEGVHIKKHPVTHSKDVLVTARTNGKETFLFIMNFSHVIQEVIIHENYIDVFTGKDVEHIKLDTYEYRIIKTGGLQ